MKKIPKISTSVHFTIRLVDEIVLIIFNLCSLNSKKKHFVIVLALYIRKIKLTCISAFDVFIFYLFKLIT